MHQEDIIVDIPENRLKFFGGPGKMLLPCPATVAALIGKIPESKLATTDLILKQLTKQFNVQGTCPVTTKKALQSIASDAQSAVAYWRVINKTGELPSLASAGVEEQAKRLQTEGFTIERSGKKVSVQQFKASLVYFE